MAKREGRPPKGAAKLLKTSLQFDAATLARLEDDARRNNRSIAASVRFAVQLYFARVGGFDEETAP